jgi:branched-chain amino acid transport system ATP-binding protein
MTAPPASTTESPSAPARTAPPGALRASGIKVHFEGVKALDGVDLELRSGEILGLIGPNGAGKTTLVNVLSGFQRPLEGAVSLDGEDVTGHGPHELARRGVVRTFQSGRYFGRLNVEENVEAGPVGTGLSRATARERVSDALELVRLAELADRPASSLTHGQERRLGVARAIAMRPRLLMLDEPATGLHEGESRELVEMLASLPRTLDCGVLVIEHDMRVIMRLCDRIQVLDYGLTIGAGTPAAVRREPAVIRAYLGSDGGGDSAPD